jgi:putative ABC transport system permease protein
VRTAVEAAVRGHLPSPDLIVAARLFDLGATRCTEIARGTVLILVVVGILQGLVAILGNLAVAAFLVGARRRIIGLRRALGATRWDIFRYLLIENLLPTQLGNLLGLLATLLALPAARALFSGLHIELVDVIVTALLLSLGGVAAKLLPAFRATRIPPSEVGRAL